MTSRPSRQVRRRRFLAALFGLYLVVLAFIAFWPSPVDSGSAGGTLRDVLAWLHVRGAPGWFNYNFVEFTANILLFVPFGFLGLGVMKRHGPGIVTTVGILVSCGIEGGQYWFLPDRFPSLSDVLANAMGTLMGAFLYCKLMRHAIG